MTPIKSREHTYISNGNGGEESRIVERQRECVCERLRVEETGR
jgi:hypothetical protein